MKKNIRVAIVLGAMMLSMLNMTACSNSEEDISLSDSAYFENIMPYQAQDLSDSISVSGTVASESSANVTTSISAKITKLNVSVGDVVKTGDVLCTLDSSDIQKQIDDLETSIKNASALDENAKKLNREALENAKYDQTVQLKEAQSQIDEAQKTYDKASKKYTETIDSLNSAVLEYNDVCSQISQLESQMANQSQEEYQEYDYSEGYDDYYGDSDDSEDYGDYYEDDGSYDYSEADLMSYTFTSGTSIRSMATNLSYDNDQYSNLVAKREELSTKIDTYKAQCEEYEEQFDSLKKAISDAKDNYTAVKRSTDQAIESAQNTVDMQDYQEDSGSATATQLENLKKQLEACTVKAEKDGTITSLNVSEGDTTAEGALLMTIENNSKLKITVSIDEKDILKVKEGMNVIVTADATGDTEIHGTVSKVITIVSSNGNSSSLSEDGSSSGSGFTAEITIDDDSDLLVGMKAKAKIMIVEKTGCYSVLYDCIMYDDDGNPYVLVAEQLEDSDGLTATVRRADVNIGEESGSYVEVTSDDLTENDLIITTPEEVSEGDTLQLSPDVFNFDYTYDDSDFIYDDDYYLDDDVEVVNDPDVEVVG